MTYLDKLTQEVNAIFAETDELEILHDKVLNLIQKKTKESFKNGLEMAKQDSTTAKSYKTKRS